MAALLRVTFRQLEYFVAVVTHETMAAAAAHCQVSQSAISLAVAELERSLQVTLFLRRKAKPLTLTAAGQQVVVEARRLLAQAEELQSNARGLGQELGGSLTVGCFPALSPFVMPTALAALGREHPGIELRFVEGSIAQLQDWLHGGVCELAVMYDVGLDPELNCTTLYRVRPHVELAPTHPLAQRRRVRLAQLADEPMIMLDMPPSEDLFRAILAQAEVTPRVARRVVSVEGVRALVAAGHGYTVLLQRPLVPVGPSGVTVAVREIAESVEPVAVQIVRAGDAGPTRRAEAFIDVCRSRLVEPARRTGISHRSV